MPGNAVLAVKDGRLTETINTFLMRLFDEKLLDALLVPMELPTKDMVAATLVHDSEILKHASPLAPVLPVSMARVVSDMTKVAPSKKKVGVVLRSCELRALVELVKLRQASLENLVLIGIDCFGTYSVIDYDELYQKPLSNAEAFLKKVKNEGDPRLREACQICQYPAPLNADLIIGLIGIDLETHVLLLAASPEGERILGALGLSESSGEEKEKREKAVAELISTRKAYKDEISTVFQAECTGLENLLSMFSKCIDCHNCRIACPMCYCKECFFDSATFEWGADTYLDRVARKGALKMPTDTLLFHLTRLNHMTASCVGCGLCQEACPNDIAVFRIFYKVGDEVQKAFDYVPGRNLDEELPLSVFREDELSEVGKS